MLLVKDLLEPERKKFTHTWHYQKIWIINKLDNIGPLT